MFSFEGNYRTTPTVSLGGQSKKSSASVIEKARVERFKREEIRKQQRSSLILQSSVRSYLVRKKCKEEFRKKFDLKRKIFSNQSDIFLTTKYLCFFYEDGVTADAERLVWLCQILLKSAKNYEDWSSPYMLARVVVLCCKCLLSSSLKQSAIPLRMLEVYTSKTFWNFNSGNSKLFEVYLSFWNRLITHGFFRTMLLVFEQKVPVDIEYPAAAEERLSPHQVLAHSLLDIIKQPFYFIKFVSHPSVIPVANVCKVEETCNLIFSSFNRTMADSMQTICLWNYIVYSLQHDENFPESSYLNFVHRSLQDQSFVNVYSESDFSNAILLVVFARLFRRFTDKQGDMFLRCVASLIPLLSLPQSFSEIDSDDEDESPNMDTDCTFKDISMPFIVSSACAMVYSDDFTQVCLKHASTSTISISTISYYLMSRLRKSVHSVSFLYSLSFSRSFLISLWYSIIKMKTTQRKSSIDLSIQGRTEDDSWTTLATHLTTFASLYSHNLISLHDADFYRTDPSNIHNNAFSIDEVIEMVKLLREICLSQLRIIFPERRSTIMGVRDLFNQISSGKSVFSPNLTGNNDDIRSSSLLFKVCCRLLSQLYTRHTRKPFSSNPKLWISSYIESDRTKHISTNWRRRNMRNENIAAHMADPTDENLTMSVPEARQLAVLTCLPFTVPFETRVSILTSMLSQDRQSRESARDILFQDAGLADSSSAIQVKVRRDFIYEDAFNDLSLNNAPDLRRVLRVTFINAAGAEEAGYGQGVTREFFQQLVRTAFDPSRGLFQMGQNSDLWPNPYADRVIEDCNRHYNFLGRLLGKILYEGMQVELHFASFFLCKLLRFRNADVDINHLQLLDPDFYRNLMYLRSYIGDVSELDLNFTVIDDRFGETKVTELIPGGQNISVTNENRVRYIHLVADYKLNVQMRSACDSFRQGVSSVLPLEWLRMFDHRELQTLISGAEVPIDVSDMKKHATYSGGYQEDNETVKMFWILMESFSEDEKRKLLFFVTSCSRPPLLGFKEMYPPFCIHNGGPADRLPTSSTCLNLLRLPQYTEEKMMKDKLLYCIESQSGFELS